MDINKANERVSAIEKRLQDLGPRPKSFTTKDIEERADEIVMLRAELAYIKEQISNS